MSTVLHSLLNTKVQVTDHIYHNITEFFNNGIFSITVLGFNNYSSLQNLVLLLEILHIYTILLLPDISISNCNIKSSYK